MYSFALLFHWFSVSVWVSGLSRNVISMFVLRSGCTMTWSCHGHHHKPLLVIQLKRHLSVDITHIHNHSSGIGPCFCLLAFLFCLPQVSFSVWFMASLVLLSCGLIGSSSVLDISTILAILFLLKTHQGFTELSYYCQSSLFELYRLDPVSGRL